MLNRDLILNLKETQSKPLFDKNNHLDDAQENNMKARAPTDRLKLQKSVYQKFEGQAKNDQIHY